MAAIFVGSGAGAMLGAVYLAAKPAQHAATGPVALAATSLASPEPGAPDAPSARTAVPSAPLPPAPLPAAKPFRFADVARGPSDLQCLTEVVYYEARGEPERGQQAVAQVVLNRVRHPAFPKTVCGVVHQRTDAGCQFSFACQAAPLGRDEAAWRRAGMVAKGALHGAVMREIGDATHFESVRAAAFAGLLKVARIGEHVFYRFGGHAGAADMFHQTPSPSAAPRLLLASAAPAPAVLAPPHASPVPASAPPPASSAKVAPVAMSATTAPTPKPVFAPAAVSAPAVVPAATIAAPTLPTLKTASATVAVAS